MGKRRIVWQDKICHLCGKPIKCAYDFSKDHEPPKSWGLESKLLPAHKYCNFVRSSYSLQYWADYKYELMSAALNWNIKQRWKTEIRKLLREWSNDNSR